MLLKSVHFYFGKPYLLHLRAYKDILQSPISTYVLGNFHKRQLGIFDFKGQADLSHFIKLTQEESLYVLLRPGPYVFAEWDFGGYPYRLLNEEGMVGYFMNINLSIL